MAKRALIVGINEYDEGCSLQACVPDATAMKEVLSRNGNDSPNFDCRLLTSPGLERITRGFLRQQWRELFEDFSGDVLFYFSGHGTPTDVGGYLVTQDGTANDPGLAMDEVVTMANNSKARTVLLILDCCFSGSIGNPPSLQAGSLENRALLREGVTILASSRPSQVSMEEIGGHGLFTNLVLGALRGGAADVRGRVSAASIYAYAEAALGAWEQRPVYKSHASHLDPVRQCDPKVLDTLLRELPKYFPDPDAEYQLDPSYEETNQTAAKTQNVEIFKKFKRFQIAGLLRPKTGDDLYWTAEKSDLAPLQKLTSLQTLNCADTDVPDLAPLQKLTTLQVLNCTGTKVSNLAPLQMLTGLLELDCAHTEVSDLAPLQKLANLQHLNCSSCRLVSVPDNLWIRTSLKSLILYKTSIPGIPTEALSSDDNDNCLHSLRAHLRDLQAGQVNVRDLKVII